MFLQTFNCKFHVRLFNGVVFLLLFYDKRIEGENLGVISEFIVGKCKFRHILFEQEIEMFVDIEGKPFPIGVVEVEELMEDGFWFDIDKKFDKGILVDYFRAEDGDVFAVLSSDNEVEKNQQFIEAVYVG